MKVAIMQPYLLPYIGYFQLIRAVDVFVVYDDVAYRKGGWINRNYMLSNEGRQLFTLPVVGGSPNRMINEVDVGVDNGKLLKALQHRYARAPFFDSVFPLLTDILISTEKNLARFLDLQLKKVCDYLGLSLVWKLSSELRKDNQLRGQEKVLAICAELGADQYVNLPGGTALYTPAVFSERDIQLSFLQPKPISYRQYCSSFEANLSIVDVLMFNGIDACAQLLEEYDLA